ncbi:MULTISPECIES: hypothetical protein [Bradyrhizobium]|jgi:hypothetical protein|uniref:Magnesium transporter MgtE intracellular domain-containing protein n=1 Tax=Bradyrhizobium elkanii TaxID=29448 RepID=A0ABV4ER03_BRAEL|nr:hypothetical protein [Bradyrhizobium elkanii]MCP1975757.1 hypothetical protein [Bradyrhizobium elkanii]MCP1984935.1 hypothetical protein [Bradyrhizobium elkanii]MCS3890711.1 hypothetical protein [Bradyrhizobium elkanii]MCS4112809.1 hypothetical protein [Bradyrhizobium elkanii]
MVDVPATRRVDPETRRALQLDTLAAILPMDRRDRVAQLLTDDDVETLCSPSGPVRQTGGFCGGRISGSS